MFGCTPIHMGWEGLKLKIGPNPCGMEWIGVQPNKSLRFSEVGCFSSWKSEGFFADKNIYLLPALTGSKYFTNSILHLLRNVIRLIFLSPKMEPYFSSVVRSMFRDRLTMDIQMRYAHPLFCFLFQVPVVYLDNYLSECCIEEHMLSFIFSIYPVVLLLRSFGWKFC